MERLTYQVRSGLANSSYRVYVINEIKQNIPFFTFNLEDMIGNRLVTK